MTGLIDWCAARARMILAFIGLSVAAGVVAYSSLPKEGSPNIDVPILYISVPLPGVSVGDSERLLVRPLETKLRAVEGLKEMTGIASENHAGILLEFDFDWNKQAKLADVRDKVNEAEAEFPDEAEEPRIIEVNLSQFPVLVVSLSGEVPERTLLKLAKDMGRAVEALSPVLEAELTGQREEMIEVLIDPLKLEAYAVTAEELLTVAQRNNQLVAAGRIEGGGADFSITLPGSFQTLADVENTVIKTNGDRVVRLGDIAEIRRTFEDRASVARYNGRPTISLQVSKRIGENIIETVDAVRARVAEEVARWPEPLQAAVRVDFAMDESVGVRDMVRQLEGAVLTAILLVMLVVLPFLGPRSALLVGFSIPCSFLLSFALMGALGLSVSNMTMFGLILAVGMLVDGGIVVVEYADKRIAEGVGPMTAYAEAAKRMAWPVISSTATTLCAFLPMLFWPGIPGKFMEQLPITLIFVLSAALIVALVYVPVVGGVLGRIGRAIARLGRPRPARPALPRQGRSGFGRMIALIVLNPVGPWVAIGATIAAVIVTFGLYSAHGQGVEFFVKTEPERGLVHVRARGNLSIAEKDRFVAMVEERVLGVDGVKSVFAFAGEGGLSNGGGGEGPPDSVGQIQFELQPWWARGPGDAIVEEIERRIAGLPGLVAEVAIQVDGPEQGKPLQLELRSNDRAALTEAAAIARARFEATPGLVDIDDTLPLPGIEWRFEVDRAAAGRYGADVAAIGPLVQLVTRGAIIDTIRPDDSDDEIDIRARFPDDQRLFATLDSLKVATPEGLVPMSNFVTRTPAPKIGEIQRRDTERFYLVRADVDSATSDIERIEEIERWIAEDRPFPAGVSARFVGDREEQAESMAFLGKAFAGALGLMFVILLAQFNSLYATVLVLSAVVLSVAGVLVGMLVMGQKFSIIMTGTGVVALAGIVVNNNIVLIDTFQDYARRMNPLEAIVRTAEDRIRPVLLTTVTTMAGLLPMMFAMSLDFGTGTIAQGAPSAVIWVQLATAVVFGLGIATVLTLVVTPAALAARVWVVHATGLGFRALAWGVLRALASGRSVPAWLRDRRLRRRLEAAALPEIIWVGPDEGKATPPIVRAAE